MYPNTPDIPPVPKKKQSSYPVPNVPKTTVMGVAGIFALIAFLLLLKTVWRTIGIREVHLPPSLQKALDAKIQAQQAAEQQQYALKQAQIKAQQAKVEAQRESEAIRVRAKAQTEANERLARSLTSELIRYQQMQKWDGKLPVFTGSGVIPMLNGADFLGGSGQGGQGKP